VVFSILKGKVVDVKVWIPDLSQGESSALDQLRNTAALPWAFRVCAMPDFHWGEGATVGSVIALRNAISPAAVGVDIGCGMLWVRTNLFARDLPESLLRLRLDIEDAVPTGFNMHKEVVREVEGHAIWKEFKDLDPVAKDAFSKARLQCGSLGGGNHFIEVVIDEEQRVGIMLHSGSRGIGNVLAKVHIEKAKKLAHNADLPDPSLAVFLASTPEMAAYRRDLFWAQRYALLNRHTMLHLIQGVMRKHFPQIQFEEPIQCHHNYVAEEIHFGEQVLVTRKGAIRAGVDDMGIIPGSMGAKSFIVRGRGNPESLCSASHGAGRRLSRNKAKKEITLERFLETTKGVECVKDRSVLDEAPDAYKPIDEVMRNQADLVEIVHELKQVLCVKAPDTKQRKKGETHEDA
jgi:tRNA-splicing ligase RtcB